MRDLYKFQENIHFFNLKCLCGMKIERDED